MTQTEGAGVTAGGTDAEHSRNGAAKTSLILGIIATLLAPTYLLTFIAYCSLLSARSFGSSD